jgi:hypothetical protein
MFLCSFLLNLTYFCFKFLKLFRLLFIKIKFRFIKIISYYCLILTFIIRFNVIYYYFKANLIFIQLFIQFRTLVKFIYYFIVPTIILIFAFFIIIIVLETHFR